jgi:hypothetical protein
VRYVRNVPGCVTTISVMIVNTNSRRLERSLYAEATARSFENVTSQGSKNCILAEVTAQEESRTAEQTPLLKTTRKGGSDLRLSVCL